MADIEKVIKALECCKRKDGNECKVCPYTESEYCTEDMATDALVLLKKQQEEIENLKQTAQSMMEGICLLKEQDAVEPLAKEDDSYECICGTIVGWNELDASGMVQTRFNYCPFCGKPISWKGR